MTAGFESGDHSLQDDPRFYEDPQAAAGQFMAAMDASETGEVSCDEFIRFYDNMAAEGMAMGSLIPALRASCGVGIQPDGPPEAQLSDAEEAALSAVWEHLASLSGGSNCVTLGGMTAGFESGDHSLQDDPRFYEDPQAAAGQFMAAMDASETGEVSCDEFIRFYDNMAAEGMAMGSLIPALRASCGVGIQQSEASSGGSSSVYGFVTAEDVAGLSAVWEHLASLSGGSNCVTLGGMTAGFESGDHSLQDDPRFYEDPQAAAGQFMAAMDASETGEVSCDEFLQYFARKANEGVDMLGEVCAMRASCGVLRWRVD
eukprot:TRINITY_DN11728_c0_g1_i8.p1 TRINITY_DN11728_c0_g1~~TRINITY_DN11728_c0_g1_i8.p1  ORF type:complete len:315 (-),score=58.49 TRINITY_DN11728_c0_g1_i8:59-1003(-)